MIALLQRNSLDFKTQYGLGFTRQNDEIIVDFFWYGGGAGTGLEIGLDRPVAQSLRTTVPRRSACTPQTTPPPATSPPTCSTASPDVECTSRPMGPLHIRPDCTHHSQAAGG